MTEFTEDKVYLVSKKGATQLRDFGDIQIGSDGFNMSFVIDGTKDSCKVIVCSYTKSEPVEPQTILYHPNTNTWWIVSNDKVERYINERVYYYIHHLELLGAIELLNARDLTDCGFNNDRYTVDDFIKRLFDLSTFEYGITIEYNGLIDEDMVVDYLKTFENYTLLSALTEFLDGYNLSPKLTFSESEGTIQGAILKIVSKSGNGTPVAISTFNDVRQITTQNKNSFGTTVVSNAENVVSTLTKVYPLVGGVKVSAEEFEVVPTNAIIRLPSNVFEVKRVSMYNELTPILYTKTNNDFVVFNYDPFDSSSINNTFQNIYNVLLDDAPVIAADFLSREDSIKQQMANYPIVDFYNVNKYNPITNKFQSDFVRPDFNNWNNVHKEYVLGAKTLRNGVADQNQVMYWEKGSNFIKGFDFFVSHSVISGTNPILECLTKPTVVLANDLILGGEATHTTYFRFPFKNTRYIIEYVPMSDLKVKLDNSGFGNDIQLYNQNGKLTDSNAFSKLLLGYSKEIESPTITRYMRYYNFSNVIKVGSLIDKNGELYVVNNVSLQFYLNEGNIVDDTTYYGYYIEAEITMSKNVATKSLLTNPNTNIRDYGIPQTNNVKRKQLYRDFYEFAKVIDDDSDDEYYLPFTKILNMSEDKVEYQDHKAVIKCDNYYYQLDTTVYVLKKSIYEIVDFQDNNIIGYDIQNKYSGFDISRVFANPNDIINTPISYVDDIGEVVNISINMCNKEQYSYILNEIDSTQGYKLAYHCFINDTLYNYATNNCDFSMVETTYNKDALEVPVFEYSCQFDDSEDVIIGENILKQDYDLDGIIHNVGFIYAWVSLQKGTANQTNALLYAPQVSYYQKDGNYGIGYNGNSTSGCCQMTTLSANDTLFYIQLLKEYFKANNDTVSTTLTTYDFVNDRDILVFRTPIYKVLNVYAASNEQTDLMFILKNANEFTHGNITKTITVRVNHYKIK